MKEFFIDKDGFKIHAKLDMPVADMEKLPLVIIVPGLTGHMDERHIEGMAEAVTEAGMAALRVELYGHGKTDGQFKNHNLMEWTAELIYIIDYAKKLPFVTDLFLMGHSQGGLAVILAAALKKDLLTAILPLAPATGLRDRCRSGKFGNLQLDLDHIPDEFQWGENTFTGNYVRVGMNLPIEASIDAYDKPVLIIHGTEDESVPFHYAEEAAARYKNCQLVPIMGDTHCYDNHLDQVKEAIKAFLGQF